MKLSPEMQQAKQIKITLVRSGIGCPHKHRAVLKGLGLRKLQHSVVRPNIPQIWGMINKVSYLVEVGLTDNLAKSPAKSKRRPAVQVKA